MDLQTTKFEIKYPTANWWGKEIIGITLSFALDCWYTRNIKEHDTDGDIVERSKEKLTEEIIRYLKKIGDDLPVQFIGMEREDFMILPGDNLRLRVEQIKKWKIKS
jgi:hypothetical protein